MIKTLFFLYLFTETHSENTTKQYAQKVNSLLFITYL